MLQPWYERMDDSGETPITRVTKCGFRELAELMLSQEAHEKGEEATKRSRLSTAAYWGLGNVVRELLDEGASPDETDEYGDLPLHRVSRNGHTEAMVTLLEHGADVNKPNKDGLTALHWVAMNGREDLARLLLEEGADANAIETHTGRLTPTSIAVLLGYDSLADLMMEHGGTC